MRSIRVLAALFFESALFHFIGCVVPPEPFISLIPPAQVPATPARPAGRDNGQLEWSCSVDPIWIDSKASNDREGAGADYAGFYQPHTMVELSAQYWPGRFFGLGIAGSQPVGGSHRVN